MDTKHKTDKQSDNPTNKQCFLRLPTLSLSDY